MCIIIRMLLCDRQRELGYFWILAGEAGGRYSDFLVQLGLQISTPVLLATGSAVKCGISCGGGSQGTEVWSYMQCTDLSHAKGLYELRGGNRSREGAGTNTVGPGV
jgi:hypothetical protein